MSSAASFFVNDPRTTRPRSPTCNRLERTATVHDIRNYPVGPRTLQDYREDATARFLWIAATIKAEAGVTEHVIRKSLGGRAYPSLGIIHAPEGRTRRQLYVLAHECAHIALRHGDQHKPRHVEEYEAEQWAHDALRRHGVPVPRKETRRAKRYVRKMIHKAVVRGAKRIDPAALAYTKRR